MNYKCKQNRNFNSKQKTINTNFQHVFLLGFTLSLNRLLARIFDQPQTFCLHHHQGLEEQRRLVRQLGGPFRLRDEGGSWVVAQGEGSEQKPWLPGVLSISRWWF